MKLLITTLTMIFISFGANAKNYKWQCQDILFKVEDPFFGKKSYMPDGKANGESCV